MMPLLSHPKTAEGFLPRPPCCVYCGVARPANAVEWLHKHNAMGGCSTVQSNFVHNAQLLATYQPAIRELLHMMPASEGGGKSWESGHSQGDCVNSIV